MRLAPPSFGTSVLNMCSGEQAQRPMTTAACAKTRKNRVIPFPYFDRTVL
jgi:hypothetical protein